MSPGSQAVLAVIWVGNSGETAQPGKDKGSDESNLYLKGAIDWLAHPRLPPASTSLWVVHANVPAWIFSRWGAVYLLAQLASSLLCN